MADRDDDDRRPPRRDKQSSGGPKKHAGKRPGGGFKPHPGKSERSPGREGRPSGAAPRPRPLEDESGGGERIAKRLARAGIASRRDAEGLIAAGRIKVNGTVLTSPAFNVTSEDRIELDGTEIPPIERTRLFLFHKPAGVVTTNRDPEGRRTVFDVLPDDLPRLMTIGRLDINTEGLLLLTNDGGLARLLELPATGWLRRYRVRVHGKVDPDRLASLKDGIAVDGVFYGSVEATFDREQGSNAWLTLGLREGKNREVRNILGALGLEVGRLIRISYGPFQLGELAEGAVQEIKGRMLREQLGERLIEESGANFEAPVAKPFSNKPVEGRREERPQRPKIVRDGIQGRIGEGGLIKRRKGDRDDERSAALSRLTTRPDRERFARPGDKGAGAKGRGDREPPRGRPFGREGDRAEPPRARTSNVWMAPGARPQGNKTAAAPEAKPVKRGAGPRAAAGERPRPQPARGERGASTSAPSSPRPPRGESERQRGPREEQRGPRERQRGAGEGQRGDRKFGKKPGGGAGKPFGGGKKEFHRTDQRGERGDRPKRPFRDGAPSPRRPQGGGKGRGGGADRRR